MLGSSFYIMVVQCRVVSIFVSKITWVSSDSIDHQSITYLIYQDDRACLKL